MNRNSKLSIVIGIIIIIVGTIVIISYQSIIYNEHQTKAQECKQVILEVLVANNRTIQKVVTLEGYFNTYHVNDLSYSWLLFYVLTENKTILYDNTYWFAFESNTTLFAFDCWSYTN